MAALRSWLVVLAALLGAAPAARAHWVAIGHHDRVVLVRVHPDRIVIDYRLEVHQNTVLPDLAQLITDRAELRAIEDEEQAHAAFVRAWQEPLRRNLDLILDGEPLSLSSVSRSHQVVVEPGVEGKQLHCEYRFVAPLTLSPHPHRLVVRQVNLPERKGRIDLTLAHSAGVRLVEVEQPSAELKARPFVDWQPGDEQRLRQARATLAIDSAAPASPTTAEVNAPHEGPAPGGPSLGTLLSLTSHGLVIALVLATVLGGAHALTPGHGKALVAAYLVGERGTVGQALMLGLVTTLAHTWSILLVAVFIQWWLPDVRPEWVQVRLELVGGLVILLLGGWLLLRRLFGQADHVHLFGGHHHHGPGHDHTHTPPTPDGKVGWGRLVLLGIGGGIIPCGDAIAIYAWTFSREPSWALPVVLAFSAGLAAVLVVLGLSVVSARRASDRVWGERPWMKRVTAALPLLSAALVTVLGLGLVVDSMHTLRQGSP